MQTPPTKTLVSSPSLHLTMLPDANYNCLAGYWRSRKISNPPRMMSPSRSFFFSSSTHLLSSSLAPPNRLCRRRSQPTQLIIVAPSPPHNLASSLPSLISLHVHSVAAAIHAFMHNTSHTPRGISHALPCYSNEKAAATKANGY
jgi:hypothetical protein